MTSYMTLDGCPEIQRNHPVIPLLAFDVRVPLSIVPIDRRFTLIAKWLVCKTF